MTRYDRTTRTLAVCLAAVAGYVDACAFIELGGFFVSFMSGNSTRLGVGLAAGSSAAATAGGLIFTFVVGVMLGSLVGRIAGRRRITAVLAVLALLLAAAAILGGLGARGLAVVCMALAMGAENAAFEKDGEVTIGLTYMTGALVKLGQRLVAALLGGDRWAWAPYFFLWLGLASGAVLGALAHAAYGLQALWLAVALVGGLTVLAVRIERAADPAP